VCFEWLGGACAAFANPVVVTTRGLCSRGCDKHGVPAASGESDVSWYVGYAPRATKGVFVKYPNCARWRCGLPASVGRRVLSTLRTKHEISGLEMEEPSGRRVSGKGRGGPARGKTKEEAG
jgi:hypothetical protein